MARRVSSVLQSRSVSLCAVRDMPSEMLLPGAQESGTMALARICSPMGLSATSNVQPGLYVTREITSRSSFEFMLTSFAELRVRDS